MKLQRYTRPSFIIFAGTIIVFLCVGSFIPSSVIPVYASLGSIFVIWSGLLFGYYGLYISILAGVGISVTLFTKYVYPDAMFVVITYCCVGIGTFIWISKRGASGLSIFGNHLFQTMFENVVEGIAIIDAQTKRLLIANTSFLRMLELKDRNEATKLSVCDVVNEPREYLDQLYYELLRTRKPFFGITQYRTSKGTIIDVERSISVSQCYGRDVFIIIARDVTEKRWSTQIIAKEHALLRTLLDTIPDVVYAKDQESRFILVNKPQIELLGAQCEDEVLGKTDHDFYPKEFADMYLKDEKELLRTGLPLLNKEESARTPNGEIRWLSTNKLPLRNQQGEVIGLVGTGRDITYLKNIEKELRERETQFQMLLDFLPVSLVTLDISGKIQFINKKFLEIFGYQWSNLVSVSDLFQLLIPDENKRTAIHQRWVVMTSESQVHGKEPAEIEFEAQCADGTQRYITLMTKVLHSTIIVVLNDVTELRKSREELEKERNLLRTVIDNLPDRIYVKDTEARFVLNNKAHIRALGAFTQEEVFGKTDFDFRPHHIAALSYADDQHVLKSGQILYSREERQRLPSGEWGWLLVTKVPIVDNNGNVTGLFGISRDVTELKKIEESLERERTLLHTLIDSIPDRIYVKDRESRYILNNKADLAVLGVRSQEETRGKTELDFKPVEFAAHSIADDQKVMETGISILNKEEQIVLPNGAKEWVMTSKIPFRNADGETIGLIGISRDITIQKEYEEKLKEERNLLRTIIDAIPDRIFVKDLQGRFILNNKAHIEALGGKSQDDVYLKTDYDFRPKALSDLYREDDMFVLQNGQSIINREQESFSADGKKGWQLSTKVPLYDEKKTIIGLLGISRDITQLKKVEQEREALIQELRDALANVKTLSGLLPICANCKRIRDDKGYWEAVEGYLMKHSEATFTHGLCPDCQRLLYPNISLKSEDEGDTNVR
ncbi:MAG: PAS domain-containing protein [Bacteroidetes bacterium]|nr:PAS domain-containing protein [Bacteroidota bacterium]